MLEGWEATSIVNLQGGEPYTLGDFSDDISLTGELNDRWNMSGPASNIHWSPKTTIPYIDPSQFITTTDGSGIQHTASGANPQAQLCVNQAFATGGQVAADQLIGNPEYLVHLWIYEHRWRLLRCREHRDHASCAGRARQHGP